MHMGIFYYVINFGILLLFSLWYMNRYWGDKFEEFSSDTNEEVK